MYSFNQYGYSNSNYYPQSDYSAYCNMPWQTNASESAPPPQSQTSAFAPARASSHLAAAMATHPIEDKNQTRFQSL